MVTFDDIEFKPYGFVKPYGFGEGLRGLIFFPGGYGLSVVRFKVPSPTSVVRYGSYTDDKTWEVAILKGTPDEWDICYDTQITEDVLGWQTEEDINKIIKHVIRLH